MTSGNENQATCVRKAAAATRRFGPETFARGAFVLLVLLTCLRVWTGNSEPLASRALAQIPDSGSQRKQLLEEARTSNQLLREIAELLRDGTLNVRLTTADTQAGAPGTPSVRP